MRFGKGVAAVMTIARMCLLAAVVLLPLLGGSAELMALAIFAVLAAGGWLAWATAKPRPAWRRVPLAWPLLAVALVTVLSTFTSVYRAASVQVCWQLAVVLALTLLGFQVPFERKHLWIGLGLFGVALLAGQLYGLWFWYTWLIGQHLLTWRVQSTWENANFYAGFLLLTLPLLCALAWYALRRAWRVVGGVAVVLGLVALALTQSRGGILAFLVVACVFGPLWLRVDSALTPKRLGLLAAGIVLFIGFALALPFGQRILNPAVRDSQAHSQQFRVYTWKADLRIAKHYPLLGSGPGTFRSVFGQYQTAGYTVQGHHTYLQTAAETGLLGLGALLWLLGSMAALGIRVLRRPAAGEESRLPRVLAVALLAGGVALGLHGLVDSDWLYTGIQLSLLLQAALVWRMAMPEEAPRLAPGWVRILLPVGMAVVSLTLLLGARAEQLLLDGENAFNRLYTLTDQAQQFDAYQEGLSDFHQALNLAPNNALYLRHAAPYLPKEECAELLQRAMRVEPTNSANWVSWGDYLRNEKRYAEAATAYATALEKQPNELRVLYRLAETQYALHEDGKALQALENITRTIGTPMYKYHPIDVPEPWYAEAWYGQAVIAEANNLYAGGFDAILWRMYASTIEAAHHYDTGYTVEAEAMATIQHTEDEREKMRVLAATAYVRLKAIAPPHFWKPYNDTVDPKLALPEKDWGNPFP